jgi:hypothetical protein
MKIQRIKFADPEGVTHEVVSYDTQYADEGWGANLPIWSRGALKAPVSLRKVPKNELSYSWQTDVYDLIISRKAVPSIEFRLDLWSVSEWEWYDFFEIGGATFRIARPNSKIGHDELNTFFGWSRFVAYVLKNIVSTERSHSLHSLDDYKRASVFYNHIDTLLRCGNVDVLLSESGCLTVFDKQADYLARFKPCNAAVEMMRLKVDEQLNIKFDSDYVRGKL